MKTKNLLFFMYCMFLTLFIAILIPSPLKNNYYDTLTSEQKMIYNDFYEQDENENYNKFKEVKNKNWFDFMNDFFVKNNVVARVIDCKTLKEYNVVRTGGYNHADVETLTKEDTETFYSIYDYMWSWERRPVWVEINGVFFAASINGMPHSYSHIENNNLAGHTCIHFLGSKTHGTKKVDEAHQSAIAYAYANSDKLINYLKNQSLTEGVQPQ